MRRPLDRRYYDDAHFAALVSQLENFLATADFTTTDIREALLLAQIKHEMSHPRPVTFSPDLQRQIDFMTKDSQEESGKD